MRIVLALPLLLAANPALAREAVPAPHRLDPHAAARMLANPMVQGSIAGIVTRLSDALMDTHVGPLAELAAPDADIASADTLGDLARRRDPEYRRRLYDNSRAAVAVTGRALGAAAAMSDELGRTVARMRRVLDDTGYESDR